jgi:hypothetical protein
MAGGVHHLHHHHMVRGAAVWRGHGCRWPGLRGGTMWHGLQGVSFELTHFLRSAHCGNATCCPPPTLAVASRCSSNCHTADKSTSFLPCSSWGPPPNSPRK